MIQKQIKDSFILTEVDIYLLGAQKPGFCPEDALQPAKTPKNPVSLILMRPRLFILCAYPIENRNN